MPLLSLGLISPRDVDLRVGELSVGQRRRLALALLVADPTGGAPARRTHQPPLTPPQRRAGGSPGHWRARGIVIASHDRWLRSRWQSRHIHLP
ncbi:hypothetical protein [Planotetraspora sp. A-T 1434]|uniref:hypothetical protein n=1 Tax=Planotetraspora sp. A-T 1434 TaxID=2979219 RepID=UPI003965CF66